MAGRKRLRLSVPGPDGEPFVSVPAPLDLDTMVAIRRAAASVASTADPRGRKYVYVVLLQGAPGHTPFSLYVGETGIGPEKRYLQHKAGIKSGKGWVRKYGIGLLPQLVARLNPMVGDPAKGMEPALAKALRTSGLTVIQH